MATMSQNVLLVAFSLTVVILLLTVANEPGYLKSWKGLGLLLARTAVTFGVSYLLFGLMFTLEFSTMTLGERLGFSALGLGEIWFIAYLAAKMPGVSKEHSI